MDSKAARSCFFGSYPEDTGRKRAEARRRKALILVKGLILDTLLVPGQNKPIHFYAPKQVLIIPMHSIAYSQWTAPEYYQGPVCAKVMLRTREVETLPLRYSEGYRENTNGLAFRDRSKTSDTTSVYQLTDIDCK